MDLLDHYRRLFAYNAWANQEVLNGFRQVGAPPPRALRLLAHVLGTEYEWKSRIVGQHSPVAIWPDFTLADCERNARELPQVWRVFLDRLAPARLGETVTYFNSKGEKWSNTIADILTHVVMHSAYHRGQIAREMREAGHQPAYTDYIHGVRQGFVE